MITMAWGGVLPIKDVKVGDEIVVYNPNGGTFETEKVEGIITREYRAMFKVHFEDGTYIHISDDHPLHIPEKGPAAIAPTGVYKDLEHVRVLKVGAHQRRLECQCACDHEDRVRRVPRYRVHV
jgi:hypothetical protein